MARPKVSRTNIFEMLALGYDKTQIKKETGIGERSYFYILKEFQKMPIEEKEQIKNAGQQFALRVFDKKAWFDRKTLQSKVRVIQRWYDIMTVRGVAYRVKLTRLSLFRNVCLGHIGMEKRGRTRIINWKIQPEEFTEEHGIRFISALKSLNIGDYSYRITIRNFLLYGKGIVPTVISGAKAGYGKMAKEYFNESEIKRIFAVIDRLPENERIPLKACILFMLHSATRISATLKFTEKGLFKVNVKVWQIVVTDKGREGKKERTKVLVSILRKALNQYIVWRKNKGIRTERLFWFTSDSVQTDYNWLKEKLKEIYALAVPTRKIKQLCHIWRHTFAMYYLRKTGWNYDLVALLGGWDDTKTLKDCYGQPDLKDILLFIEKMETERGEKTNELYKIQCNIR